MRTLALDSDLKDLAAGVPPADGADGLRMRVVERLRHVRGTWFADRSSGVPWLDDIVSRLIAGGTTSDYVPRAILDAHVRAVDGVTGLSGVRYTFDHDTRTVHYSVVVGSADGDVDVDVELELV